MESHVGEFFFIAEKINFEKNKKRYNLEIDYDYMPSFHPINSSSLISKQYFKRLAD